MSVSKGSRLIAPYGGRLVDLLAPEAEREELRAYASQLPSLQLSDRSVCDLELLATGGFSPLDRFMGAADHRRVLDEMRLADGHVFPIPVTLPVDPGAPGIHFDTDVALRNAHNDLLAVMTIEEIYAWDPDEVRRQGLRHARPAPPPRRRDAALGQGQRLRPAARPPTAQALRLPRSAPAPRPRPARVLEATGRENVVAFQTRNPLHRVHEELTKRAAREVDGVLLLHPVVGHDQAGRRRPLHPRAHLQGAGRAATTSRTGSSSRCCRWRCAWAGRARPSGTP